MPAMAVTDYDCRVWPSKQRRGEIPVDPYRVPGMQSVGRLAVSPIRFAGLRVEGDLEISDARDYGRIQSASVSDSLHHVRGPNVERRRLSKRNRSQECWH